MDIERDIDLDGEVATHGTDAAAIGVFEAAEVRLVGFVKEVLTHDGEFDAVVTVEMNIRAEGEIAEGIVEGSRFGVLEGKEMVLTEVVFHAESEV